MAAFPVARLTETDCAPRTFFTALSTVATQDAHDIPTTGSVVSVDVPGGVSDPPPATGAIVVPPTTVGDVGSLARLTDLKWRRIVRSIIPIPSAFVARPNRMIGTL